MTISKTKNKNQFEGLAFIKEVAKYFMDFLETDFHKRKNPKRNIKLRNEDNLLLGINYEKVKERVTRYSNIIGLPYSTIKISTAQKRLCSCSVKGCLNFSWRLIIAPLEIIDYVVVHELIHLEVRNHSANFWSKVKIVLPNYAKHLNWLKNNEYLLHI